MVAVICVPDVTWIGVFQPFASGAIAIIDGDMAALLGGSELEKGGWGGGWGAVGWPGIQFHCSGAAGGGFWAKDRVVVVVDNKVVIIDCSCAVVARGDMAHVGGVDRLVGVSLSCMLVPQVLGGSVDIPTSFSSCGSLSLGTICIMALAVEVGVVCVAVDCHWGLSLSVCVAISWVVVFFGVPLYFTPCIILLNSPFAIRYPSSWPKFIPSSMPSFIPNLFPFFILHFSPSSIACSQSNLRFALLLVEEAKVQNWPMLL